MKHFFYFIFLAVFVSSCSTEVDRSEEETPKDSSVDVTSNKADVEPVEKEYLFESDEEGVKEFMRCTVKLDGSHEWVYFTARDEQAMNLGSTEKAGFEVVYFYGKPKERYWIYGSECGFTLSDDTRKTSQWYGQVTPRCADDMFEALISN
ncbi:MAG: hypothetical protein COA38_19445 [Fluviicola sp.]|nr:MAG: hypothetical protein COA38_19445 [Fluviicola sp.]